MTARNVNRLTIAFFLGIGVFALTGCYTVEGVGRDVSALGTGVAETAEVARPYEETGNVRPTRR